MKTHQAVIVCLLSLCVTALAGEVEISNPKALFPAKRIVNKKKRWHPTFAARLNPKGSHLIYPKLIENNSEDGDKLFDLEVFDIDKSQKHTISVQLPSGFETVFTRFNCFDPSGLKLSVFRRKLWIDRLIKDKQFSRKTEIVLYDLKANKFITTGLIGQSQLARFDSTGQYLFLNYGVRGGQINRVALSDFNPKPTPLPGWIHSPCMYSEYSTVFVSRRSRGGKSGLEIWNIANNKMLCELPVHPQNSQLDDASAQWTSDGRYVYYLDFKQQNDNKKLSPITRVWDVKTNKQKPEIAGALSIGPGPGKSSMVMVRLEDQNIGGMLLHDAKENHIVSFGPADARLIHAWGNKIVYVLLTNDVETVYVADLSNR